MEEIEVTTAEDGERALTMVRTFKPDLILLDVLMPGRSGYEVLESLKADPATRLIPVVLITGLGETPDRVRGIRAGADGFLSKPFSDEEFIAHVKSRLLVKSQLDELEPTEKVLLSMARAIEERDSTTAGHCQRLSVQSAALAARMGLSERDQKALAQAGYLHDIGKLGTPDAVLLKPGPLTREERTIMEEHTVRGEEICRPLKSFARVLPIIRHHHERYDGTGYPDGLKGSQIPLTVRVLQIVDVYDALTSVRPYKPAMSSSQALTTLEAEVAQGWWDPDVFAAFRDMVIEEQDTALREGESTYRWPTRLLEPAIA